MPDVYVAGGSNIDPAKRLNEALAALEQHYRDIKVSRAYRNKAVGFEGEDFINLVARITTDESIAEVLATLHKIEEACGRPRNAPKWAPRAMDLDILLYGDQVGTFPGVTLPRPDLVKRPYMLGPIAEIAPELVHPTMGKTMQQLWAEFDKEGHGMEVVELNGRG